VTNRFFTVGHSDRTIGAFLALLAEARVTLLVDVRKLPGSRSNPQFDEEALAPALADAGIRYRHEAALGGLRPVSKTIPFEVNALWRNRSFHNYADYALSDAFGDALRRLRSEGAEQVALMCSEAVWWRCHRRIIADHLLAAGEDVRHLMGSADGPRIDPATLTPGAHVGVDGQVTYPSD
jgi:uncharacterized protein (DUF488 family)